MLHLWKHLFTTMNTRPTHLRELLPHKPTWFGATDACGNGLGGVFFDKKGAPYVWQLPLPQHLRDPLRTWENSEGQLSINALELSAHVVQLLLKAPLMAPLEHTLDGTDST